MTSDYLYAVVVVTQAQERLNMAIRANGWHLVLDLGSRLVTVSTIFFFQDSH